VNEIENTTTLPDREHRHGCPAEPERTETYPAARGDGSEVEVTRCIDCGGQSVREEGGDHE
jgi:hypothetical protein